MKHDHGGIEKQKQGLTSITFQDSNLVFKELGLKQGDFFLDLGCGPGDYAFQASELVGKSGFVYALERWEELISKLNEKIASQNIENMRAMPGNLEQALPIPDNSIDVCLIAMVLHGFDIEKYGEILFSEINRILKPSGRLAVLEMQKQNSSKGHPAHIRLSPAEIADSLRDYDFKQISYADFEISYIIQFGISK